MEFQTVQTKIRLQFDLDLHCLLKEGLPRLFNGFRINILTKFR